MLVAEAAGGILHTTGHHPVPVKKSAVVTSILYQNICSKRRYIFDFGEARVDGDVETMPPSGSSAVSRGRCGIGDFLLLIVE
jgi:hypothetical protein